MEPNTLFEAWQHAWIRWPAQPALIYGENTITYAQLEQAVMTLAAAYRRLGIERGARIICAVSNRPETIMAMGAAWAVEAVHVGVDYQFTAHELAVVIELTQAKLLICESRPGTLDPLQTARTLGQQFPDLGIIVIDDGLIGQPMPEGCRALATLMHEHAGEQPIKDNGGPAPQDPAMIFISSGTTGKPKGAVGYHGNLCQRWRRLGGWLKFEPDDVHLAQLPLSHGFGLMMAVAALLAGGRLVLLNDFTAEAALQLVTSEGVTVLNGAPAHFKLLLNRLDTSRDHIHTLRLSVGTAASFPPPLVRSIWEKLGVEFMFMYGSSEGVGVATVDRDEIMLGSVGRPAPDSVIIVDTAHKPLPVGEAGEIAFSRRVFPVRYWVSSDQTGANEAMPNGDSGESEWYYSGDLGRLDDEGRLYVFGRLKQQIDRGGVKIDPVEVEAALLDYPGVDDGAVIGLPNPILGESVCACIVTESVQPPSLEEVRAFLSDRLAPYKLPEELCILDQIRRTQIGKVDLKWLRAEVITANRQYQYQR